MERWINENQGLLPGAVNIGLIKTEGGVFLIDTGIDNTSINKVIKNLNNANLEIQGALITHHHADHMGGCSKLSSLGIDKIYGPKEELEFFVKPSLEPFTMFSGALPPKKLKNKHLEAKPIEALLSSHENQITEVIDCPGHSPGHTAYLLDDVLYSGDAAFTQETIEKYKLLFAVNPTDAANSLEILSKSNFSVMIPGHGPVSEDRKTALDVISATKDHYLQTKELVLSFIGEKINFNEFVPKVLEELKLGEVIKNRGITQYFLFQTPLQGYLANLMDDKKVELVYTSKYLEIIST